MLRASLVACAVFMTTTGYNYDFYHNPSYSWSPNRRVDGGQDAGAADGYQSGYNDRAANERSISYRTDGYRDQQVRGRIRVAEEVQARNGNTTYKLGSNSKNYPSIGNRRGGPESDSEVIFPGPTSRRSLYVPEVPAACQELGLCENVPNYPYEYVENLIAKAGNLTYFNVDILTPEISQRRGSDDREVLCKSKETVIYPEAAKTVDGKWVYVMNKKIQKVQGFKIEICENPDKQCNPIAYVEEKYRLECGQKTTQRAMWSVTEAGYVKLEMVTTPSCCSCVIKDNKKFP